MTRLVTLVFCAAACALLVVSANADDPPKKLTTEERGELEGKLKDLYDAGQRAYRAGQHAEAMKAFGAALDVARRLYPKAEFPDGHLNLAQSLTNLALLSQTQGKLADAELLG